MGGLIFVYIWHQYWVWEAKNIHHPSVKEAKEMGKKLSYERQNYSISIIKSNNENKPYQQRFKKSEVKIYRWHKNLSCSYHNMVQVALML